MNNVHVYNDEQTHKAVTAFINKQLYLNKLTNKLSREKDSVRTCRHVANGIK